jgi:nucleoside-diphosphate-sugar epimerase
MNIFITGATGYIGGSVAHHLQEQGHRILGLARSEEKAAALRARGIEAVIGNLNDPAVLIKAAQQTDATINAADSDHLGAAQVLIGALAGTGKALIHTSGSSIVADDALGEFASERVFADDAPYTPMPHRLGRIAVDNLVRESGIGQGIRAAVICPTTIYGSGRGLKIDSDQVPKVIVKSRQRGAGVYIGKGANIWSNVFIDDLSALYGLLLTKAPAGSFFFVENGENSLKDVAIAVSNSLGFEGRTESWDLHEAVAEYGEWARIALATNCRVRATNARAIGWKPTGPSLAAAISSS